MADTTLIRSAATIVLARDGDDGMEICLLKRSAKSSFMASVMVYPGGALEEADFQMSGSPYVHASRSLWSSDVAQAHALASLREAFEESGLLASTRGDASPTQHQLDALRLALRAEQIGLSAVLDALQLTVDLDALWFFDRWVTPPWESKRYDTWFFLARAPRGQRARSDGQEVTSEQWMTPDQALNLFYKRELMLAPPTWATLRDLRAFASVDEAIAYAQTATPYPICPYFSTRNLGGDGIILLPGDRDYPGFEDVETVVRGVPRRTRILMKDGLWSEDDT